MPRFSANISILFTELPFMERLDAARAAGFDAVECWFPCEHDVGEIRRALKATGLRMVGINTAPGAAGEWGLAALPGRETEFLATLDEAVDAAMQFGGCAVHVMGGLTGSVPGWDAWRTYVANLRQSVARHAGSGVQLLIEPLNTRDRPGYILNSVDQAAQVIESAGLGSLKMMFDCYHVQVQDGDLVTRLCRHWDKIGHIQVGNTPARSEPDLGEINYPFVFQEIDRLGWQGWVGAEYRPSRETAQTLAWMRATARGGVTC